VAAGGFGVSSGRTECCVHYVSLWASGDLWGWGEFPCGPARAGDVEFLLGFCWDFLVGSDGYGGES